MINVKPASSTDEVRLPFADQQLQIRFVYQFRVFKLPVQYRVSDSYCSVRGNNNCAGFVKFMVDIRPNSRVYLMDSCQ